MKKHLSILPILLTMSFMSLANDGGMCGDNLTWYYDSETFTLTIGGMGDMYEYEYGSDCPWGEYGSQPVDDIFRIVIGSGATSLCYDCFRDDYVREISVDPENLVFDSRDNCNAIILTQTNTLVVGCGATIIPNTVTTIQERAFFWIRSLVTVDIPDSVKIIGDYAFHFCTNITSLTIGNSVEKICTSAFTGAENIRNIYCYAVTPPTVDYVSVFDLNVELLATLYVPAGCKDTYSTAIGWRRMLNIVEMVDAVSETQSVELEVFPNPAVDCVKVIYPDMKSIEVFSCDGKLVDKMTVSGDDAHVDLSGLHSGIYTLRVVTKNNVLTSCFVKK